VDYGRVPFEHTFLTLTVQVRDEKYDREGADDSVRKEDNTKRRE
jgi:hypothetical protein